MPDTLKKTLGRRSRGKKRSAPVELRTVVVGIIAVLAAAIALQVFQFPGGGEQDASGAELDVIKIAAPPLITEVESLSDITISIGDNR